MYSPPTRSLPLFLLPLLLTWQNLLACCCWLAGLLLLACELVAAAGKAPRGEEEEAAKRAVGRLCAAVCAVCGAAPQGWPACI